ncbi:hypothetical protein [Erwinia amylovora]|uniref:hypothetical protein n=1 Tax=Erwinia amylovora TaxID=552 RepID=UPI0003A35DD3|nr:hypothetical protein [Erwinia amylovora]
MRTPRFTAEFEEDAVREITKSGNFIVETSDNVGWVQHFGDFPEAKEGNLKAW